MPTPLTDAITALTTYANTVTGASDTTLSDAVATLASGYGGGTGGLYPLGENRNLNYCNIKITNGNHLRIDFKQARSGTYYLNLRYLIDGTTQATLNNDNLWFTIPANSDVVLSISNYSTDIPNTTMSYNFRRPNSTVSVPSLTTGQISSNATATVHFDTSDNVGNMFAYSSNVPSSGYIEFDVSLTINGVRYI